MSAPQLLMWTIVVAVGLFAARHNPTAAALVLAWLVAQVTWLITGNNLPLSTYFMADVAVIVVIFAKMIVRVGARKYPSVRLQFYCMFMDLTVYDRFVVGIFLLGAWPLYVLNIDAYQKWWLLYYLAIAQFLFAGAEAIMNHKHVSESRASEEPPDNGLAMAGAYRNYG